MSPSELPVRRRHILPEAHNVVRLTLLDSGGRHAHSPVPTERTSHARGGRMGIVSMQGATEFVNAAPHGGGLLSLTVRLAPVAARNREEHHVTI